MDILVTGASGFVGKNLVASLKNLQQKKDHTRPELLIKNIYEYDTNTNSRDLAFSFGIIKKDKKQRGF